jgi:hypothetical protein
MIRAEPASIPGPRLDLCGIPRTEAIAAAEREGLDRFANTRYRDELEADAALAGQLLRYAPAPSVVCA